MNIEHPFDYSRRATVPVAVGRVTMGSGHPVVVQSMTNTNTDDIDASMAQCQRLDQAGCEIVRLTTQGVREVENLAAMKARLRDAGCQVPLVADIHFNPRAAFAAARVCEGVRINPGNFVDPARQFKSLSYTDEEYAAELQRISDTLLPFIALCREHHTAVRLGVNHGSLSDRIMSRYGNTAAGMVESVMEFLRVFVREQFTNVVISMKASNVVVMVEAVRRLVAAMDAEDMHFPLHLGVTEAGFGEDGRVKSAVGIGALLGQGYGDTVRVSLSEEPEAEVPVARLLVDYVASRAGHEPIGGSYCPGYDPLAPVRKPQGQPIVIASCKPSQVTGTHADYYFSPTAAACEPGHNYIVPAREWHGQEHLFPIYSWAEWTPDIEAPLAFVQVPASTPVERLMPLKGRADVVLAICPDNRNIPGCELALLHALEAAGIGCRAVLCGSYDDALAEALQVKAGADMGAVLLAGMGGGLWLHAPNLPDQNTVVATAFGILQAARLRTTVTEFISCPGCGRTLFDLVSTTRQVKAATAHLTHLKIGVMGCIVNGPGEMADADYGYVGSARGQISLYKNKTCVERNIPQEQAIERLVQLIKDNGDWREPAEG